MAARPLHFYSPAGQQTDSLSVYPAGLTIDYRMGAESGDAQIASLVLLLGEDGNLDFQAVVHDTQPVVQPILHEQALFVLPLFLGAFLYTRDPLCNGLKFPSSLTR